MFLGKIHKYLTSRCMGNIYKCKNFTSCNSLFHKMYLNDTFFRMSPKKQVKKKIATVKRRSLLLVIPYVTSFFPFL